MPELDHALEWCENEIIARYSAREQDDDDLQSWFTAILGNAEEAAELARHCERIEIRAFDIIARAGEPADSMLFILNGRVGVTVDAGDGRLTRCAASATEPRWEKWGLCRASPAAPRFRRKSTAFFMSCVPMPSTQSPPPTRSSAKNC
jgi:SulP family sulfate permease